MELKENLHIETACEQYLTPVLKIAEQAGRHDIVHGALIAILSICELSEQEETDFLLRINTVITNRVIIGNRGTDEIMTAAGYSNEELAKIRERITAKMNGVSNATS